MTKNEHEILETRTVHEGWAKLLIATIRTREGRIRREIEDHGNAVCVLPYDPRRRTAVLVRQFRAPVYFAAKEDEHVEAIAGILEDEEPATCARREAMEEAGLALEQLEPVVSAWTMPGVSTERMHLFLATYSAPPHPAKRMPASADEDVSPFELGLTELVAMTDGGELTDMKTFLLVQTLRLRRPALFRP